jgi:hypothetical protein
MVSVAVAGSFSVNDNRNVSVAVTSTVDITVASVVDISVVKKESRSIDI